MCKRDIFIGRASLIHNEGSSAEYEVPCDVIKVNGCVTVLIEDGKYIAHYGDYIAVLDSDYAVSRFKVYGYITRDGELRHIEGQMGYYIPFAGTFAYVFDDCVFSFHRRRLSGGIFWEVYLYRPDGKLIATGTVKGDYALKGAKDGYGSLTFVHNCGDMPDITVTADMCNCSILFQ